MLLMKESVLSLKENPQHLSVLLLNCLQVLNIFSDCPVNIFFHYMLTRLTHIVQLSILSIRA